MIICGINLTHDGAISLIDGTDLVFSYECEKFSNNKRHSPFILDLLDINNILAQHGYSLEKIDRFVLDGWGENWLLPEVEEKEYTISASLGSKWENVRVSRYGHLLADENVLESIDFRLEKSGLEYRSYMHISGHIFGAYCTSPFAKQNASSFVLVWDGAMTPQLFHFDPRSKKIRNCGSLFPVLGSIYTLFPHEYEPFNFEPLSLSIAGKAMAYVAVGKPSFDVIGEFRRILSKIIDENRDLPQTPLLAAIITKTLIGKVKEYGVRHNIEHADMIASFHYFFQDLLVSSLAERIKRIDLRDELLCFAGGCALNIKWNSALRDAGIFDQIWVPPFPNDSGSAIGAGCCELVASGTEPALEWSVYRGPDIGKIGSINQTWQTALCSPRELADILHKTGEPILFLHGRAELGPRALGNRSILAAPTLYRTKNILNQLKFREDYRPIAPVCMQEDAPEVFDPGTPDPYMLFEHKVRDAWREKIPAVCHLDGTARLQTVTQQQNPHLYDVLVQYKQLSGIPLLCNTSANHKGAGFFPNLESAMDWGRLKRIWSNGYLYSRSEDAQ